MRVRSIFDATVGRPDVAAFVTVVAVGLSLALTCAIGVSGGEGGSRTAAPAESRTGRQRHAV
jgi:hypothetical protein